MRLYNPRNGTTFDTNSDDEWHVQVYLEMGWEKAPEPPPTPPGLVPEPVTYAPVTKPKRRGTATAGSEPTDS